MSSFSSTEILLKEMAAYSLLQDACGKRGRAQGKKKLDVRVGRQEERVS